MNVMLTRGSARVGQHPAMRQARHQPLVLVLLECLLAVGLTALVYLGQVGAVNSANAQLQTLQARHAALLRQDALLHAELGQVESPAYIDQQARRLGYVPVTYGRQP